MQTLTKTIKITFIAGLALLFFSAPALAAQNQNPVAAGGTTPTGATHPCHPELDNPPGQPLTSGQVASCQACSKNNPTTAELQNCLKKNPIVDDLKTVIKFLSAGVGIVIVGSIITGGIQYTMAGNNPNAVSAAKSRITNALIALVTFFFIVALLNFLIPGGLIFS